ncbi:MAG: DUF3124 domain-containing protein [Geobacteraceae bacterium]|nr:DUF3124 domain-containing protein [Geobacteraceae bacterium]
MGGFMKMPRLACLTVTAMLLLVIQPVASLGAGTRTRTVYVPVYSHVYTGNKALPVNLATTLSVRNTDPKNRITIVSADYYSSEGKLIRRMLGKPFSLAPLASASIFIKEKDTTGGFGASFLVRWHATSQVSTPVIECLMIGAYSGLGISFVSPGQEIH